MRSDVTINDADGSSVAIAEPSTAGVRNDLEDAPRAARRDLGALRASTRTELSIRRTCDTPKIGFE
jgi:hypothetical protein